MCKKIVKEIKINNNIISYNSPVYFIADIASNHDGSIERAKDLIYLAKESGADAVKFQHFTADNIASDYGFKKLGEQKSHQASWKKSVYETYRHYECNKQWTKELVTTCKKVDVEFMTTPYDFDAIDMFSSIVPAFKIGSGDITWIEAVKKVASCQKPVFLATGASSAEDVERAVESIININHQIVLMQCNTNYTADYKNFRYINLNVLKTFADKWPGILLGLSDHTLGYATVLGAITLGARVVEKHFTDDNLREGPDHAFSMNPSSWKEMVKATRELEQAFGDGIKRVENNEKETAVLQRRCIRLKEDKKSGYELRYEDFEFLRPAPENSLAPYMYKELINKKLKNNKKKGEALCLTDVIESMVEC